MTDAVNISWCLNGVGLQGEGNNITFVPTLADAELLLPELPEWVMQTQCVYIPLEHTLTRFVTLPLKSTKHLDADMLLQELSDSAGIEPDDWWLTWQMHSTDEGIAGLVFGIKKDLKQALQSTPAWQSASLMLVDGWQRLNQWLDNENKQNTLAVIDEDDEGVFFGFIQDGIWQGMRRLNGKSSTQTQEITLSLASMGYDKESMPLIGRFTQTLTDQLPQASEAVEKETLPHRYIANLTLPKPSAQDKNILNLRHGKWTAKQTSAEVKAWYRPMILAAVIALVWMGSMVAQNYQLEAELETMQDDINNAFHRGLPEQPVIIDAIAQLRQAAGGSAGTSSSNASKQLYAISQTFSKQPWQMQELSMGKRGTNVSGKVKDLNTLNTIRDDLATRTQADVQIVDTDLTGNEVSFRMRW